MYVNIRGMSQFLAEYNSSQDFYLGHWHHDPGYGPSHANFRARNYSEAKKESFYYAGGAAYCISASVLPKMEKYVRHKGLVKICTLFNFVDDVAIGAVVGWFYVLH